MRKYFSESNQKCTEHLLSDRLVPAFNDRFFLHRLRQDQQQHSQYLSNPPLIHTLTFPYTHFHHQFLSLSKLIVDFSCPRGQSTSACQRARSSVPERTHPGRVKGRRQEGRDQARAGICHAPRVARTNLVAWVWVVLGEALSWPFLRAACVQTGGLCEPGSRSAGRVEELEQHTHTGERKEETQ